MDRWRRIDALFDEAVKQPPSDRDAYLRRACGPDLELYREVTSLLSHDADGTNDESWAARAAAALLEERSRSPQHSSSNSSLAPGMSLGPYRITGVVGAGAMGEVYRARDSHLNRDVALKVLPELFALDPDRLARLRREAQVLASLNHQNIAAIYGFEDRDSIQALVLEFVDGPTLAERIAHGPIPLDQALPIAKQIAEALQAAHEHGIIHRDLKPANVKIPPDGTAKLLDFGLAKALDPVPGIDASRSAPLPNHELTDGGVILGTWAYMSPEQARGVRVDSRTDVWAFGCILYEMLTGHRAFDGPTSSDVLAAVLEREPDYDALPAETPENISRLLRRALTKDVRNRLHAIGDARLDIVETLASMSGAPGPRTDRASRVMSPLRPGEAALSASFVAWRRLALTVGVLGIAVAPAIVWMSARQPRAAPPVSRYELRLPEAAPLLTGGTTLHLAISRDGTRRVYPTNRGLAVQSRDNLDVRVIESRYSVNPFFSPDGQWIGFIGDGLRRVAVTGGPTTLLAPAGPGATATWGEDGVILADAKGLFRVAHADGIPQRLPGGTLPDNEQAAFPEALPGGSAVLFTVISTRTNTPEIVATSSASRIEALDLRSGSRKVVVRGGGRPRYLPTGYLVYGSGEAIMAVAFDADRLETRGDPVQVADRGGASFAVSNEGTLIYVTGKVLVAGNTSPLRRLVWVDRRGREEDLGAQPAMYVYPRLSPDGSRVAVDIYFENRDIYIWNIERKLLERFTLDPAEELLAQWDRDGTRLVWANARYGGVPNLFMQAADRSGKPERLIASDRLQYPSGFAPDGRLLFVEPVSDNGRQDLMALSLDTRRAEPVIVTEASEGDANVSPDGHWIAYTSDESGSFEVYVNPYPNTDGGKWKVSTSGGKHPLWSRNGRELDYRDFAGAIVAVPVPAGPRFLPGKPVTILPANSSYVGEGVALSSRSYDLSLDGTRFLMVKRVEGTGARLMVVEQNWTEEVKRLVPRK